MNRVTEIDSLSGMHYHVSHSLGEVLTPSFMAVILSTVHYFRCLEMYDLLLDPVF